MKAISISSKNLFQYGFIALPVAFAGFPLYILAPDFYATHHGLSLTVLGSLLLALRLFDAALDPIIGWLMDKLRGQFVPVVGAAAVILCLSINGLFNFVLFTPVVWFAGCIFFAVGAYSALTIALGAQATLWTSDTDDQTRIAVAREAFGLAGLVMAVSLPALLVYVVNRDDVYRWYSVILGLLMIIGVVSFAGIVARRKKKQARDKKSSPSLLTALRMMPRESIRFYGVYGLSMLASSIPAILVIFYVRDLLGVEHLTGVFLFLYFLSGAVAMPFWKSLSHYLGKDGSWACSNILAVVGFVGAFFLTHGDVWSYAMVCVISGFALGADLTLPPSILAGHIHARGNAAFSGMYYSFLTFIAKASLAMASAIAFPLLDAVGFKPQGINSDHVLTTLAAAYALIPCVLKLIAAVLLYFLFVRSQSGGPNETVQDLHDHRSDFHA